MTIKRRKLSKGIRIKPNSDALEAGGEITVDNVDGKIKAKLGGYEAHVVQDYTAGQKVNYLGTDYICILDTTTSQLPTDPTYWSRYQGDDRSLVTEDQAQTLTNKTIDANGTGNNISNLETDDFAANVVDTDVALTADSDTRIASQKATKAYVDSQVASKDEASEISYTQGANTKVVGADVQAALDAADTEIAANATAIGVGATDLTLHEADTSTHGVVEIVGTTEAQTLTNKTIQGASLETPSRSDVKQDTEANLITYAGSAANGQLCFATDTKKMYQVIDSALESVGGGGSTQFEINQVAHGLAVGNGIYHNGTIFVKAQADDANTLAYYVVMAVEDVDNFTAVDMSRVEAPSHGYTVGEFYFLSDATAGLATNVEPSSGFSNPLFYVEDANTLQVKCLRPGAIAGINLDELDDVSVPTPTDNQVLAYNNGNSRWEAADAVSAAADVTYDNATSGLTATQAQAAIDEVEGRVDTLEAQGHDMNDLTDVDNTIPAKGDMLVYNSVTGNYEAIDAGANGEHLVYDDTEDQGIKTTAALSGTLNPVTDWTSYPIEVTASTTNPTFGTNTKEAYYRRVGDNLEVKFTINQTTSGSGGAGTYYFGIPSGLTVDESKLTINFGLGLGVIGSAHVYDNSVGELNGIVRYDNGNIILHVGDQNTQDSVSSGYAETSSDNIMRYSASFSVPIQGWTSGLDAAVQNLQLTAQTANELSARVTNNGAADKVSDNYDFIQSVTRSALGKVDVVFNSGIFTVPPVVLFTSNGGNANHGMIATSVTASGFTAGYVNASNLFEDTDFNFQVSKQGADVNKSQVIAGTFENINSSDLIDISYKRSTVDPMFNNAYTGVSYNSLVRDNSNGAYSGGVFTAPRAGNYLISANVRLENTSWNQGELKTLQLLYAGGQELSLHRREYQATNSDSDLFGGCQKIYLEKNETVQVRVFQNSGASVNLQADGDSNTLTITELPDTESIIKNLNDQEATVAARYTRSTSQTINNTNVLEYDIKDRDTHNAYNTATGEYTVPLAGWYNIGGAISYNTQTWNYIGTRYKIDGVIEVEIFRRVTGTDNHIYDHNNLLYLEKDQILTIFPYSGATGATITGVIANFFSIARIK